MITVNGIECEVAESYWDKFRGLMLKKDFKPLFFDFGGEAKNRCALHTFFMLEPIDIVFINSKNKVVDIQTAEPWNPLIRPKEKARYVVELPKGMGERFSKQTKVKITKA